jgi:hypothetical protein
MEALQLIWDCLDWVFIVFVVLSGRVLTNWIGEDVLLPKPWIVLVFATIMSALFVLARASTGSEQNWECYLHSYVFATVFYQYLVKYIMDAIEPLLKKMKT